MEHLPSQPEPLLDHPKMKPLLRLYSQENQLNEDDYYRFLKLHSKPFRRTRNDTRETRGSFRQLIEGYRQVLTPKNSLSKLSYSFGNGAFFETAYIFSKIRGSPNLTSLEVQISTDEDYLIPLEILFKSLTYLKGLASFRMEFQYHHFTDRLVLPMLFRSLRCLKKLKSFSLSFFMCQNLQKIRVHYLPKYLIHLKQLQSLQLAYDRPTDLQDPHIVQLASALSKLPQLTQISLSLGGYGRMIQRGSTLLKILDNIKTLQDINLSFNGFYLINREANDFLVEGLRQLDAPSLRKLRLHVHQNPTPQDFIDLCQTFTRFTSLNLLHLNLHDCQVLTQDTFSQLCSAVSRLTTLSSFGLKILSGAKGGPVIGRIASAIKSLQNLVHLKLSFGMYIESHPDEISELSASLMTLSCLKSLDLSFALQKSLSDDVLESFSESLEKVIQLNHLVLDFSDAKGVTVQGVGFLTNAIAKMSGLSFLDLSFVSVQEINEEAIERISQALWHLPSLYSVNFKFSLCIKIRDNNKSLLSLFDVLNGMMNIRKVVLYIPRNKINEREVDDMQKKKMLSNFWC